MTDKTITIEEKNGLIKDPSNEANNNTKSPVRPALHVSIEEVKNQTATMEPPEKKVKKKHRDKSDLGENFVAPDGGWGWVVAIASGVNILVTFALAQNFGIIFLDHLTMLDINKTQLTTIINIQIATSAFTGLLNGPLFRRYTYRQVALVGSLLTFLGLFLAVFSESFMFYVLSFSLLYGLGRGLTVSASSLAVNTFFKLKRRTATAFQFGVAGMGPIVLPHLARLLLMEYGVRYTVLTFAGASLNTIACSLIYQPVKWHVKKIDDDIEQSQTLQKDNDDDIINQITDPETPTLPRANDGWFGSRTSLNSVSYRNRLGTWEKQKDAAVQMQELRRLSSVSSRELRRLSSREGSGKPRSFSTSHSIKEEDDDHEQYETLKESELRTTYDYMAPEKTTHALNPLELKVQAFEEEQEEVERRKKLPILKKIIIFFDFDLLRDITYVNLAVGLTVINFVEVNFAILTPFILSDFGFDRVQTTNAMSLLGLCDLVLRFGIPLITMKMNYSNKVFFMIGIAGMCLGRILLSFTRNYYLLLAIFFWLGLSKAFRTVFWSIIIPSYVPLKRLPAAAGLQLLMTGIFSLAFGPLIGYIRDQTNYVFTLNFLNGLCILALAVWVGESVIKRQPSTKS